MYTPHGLTHNSLVSNNRGTYKFKVSSPVLSGVCVAQSYILCVVFHQALFYLFVFVFFFSQFMSYDHSFVIK